MRHNFDRYCKNIENVENYEKALADNFKGWNCHHRREANFSRKELIALGMYYNVSSEELIFLTIAEHNKLHKKGNTYFLGKHHSEESKNKLSEAHKGKQAGENNPMYGKHHTLLSIRKISEANKGKKLSEEHKKKLSKMVKGKHWYNNGKISIRRYECPDGFTPGRLS